MALKDLFKKLFNGETHDEPEVKPKTAEPPKPAEPKPETLKPEAPKFEPPTSAEINLPRIMTVDGIDYGVDDGMIDSLKDTKNFSSFKVRNDITVEVIDGEFVAFANGVEIGKFDKNSAFGRNYPKVLNGEAYFKAQISGKDEEKGKINLVYYIYTKLDTKKSMSVKLYYTFLTDFLTGEYRYDNLANMDIGEEVRLTYVPKALLGGGVDHTVEELAATDLYGSNELGIILPEDEKELKARFITVIPLICKLETLEWGTEGDNSTITATIRAYDFDPDEWL